MKVVAAESIWKPEGTSDPARKVGLGDARAGCSQDVVAGDRTDRTNDAGPVTGWDDNCCRGRRADTAPTCQQSGQNYSTDAYPSPPPQLDHEPILPDTAG